MAIRDVGTWMTGIPLMKVAATKPARSPTTPPPRAMTAESRPKPLASIWSVSRAQVSRVLWYSPAGKSRTSARSFPSPLMMLSAYLGPTFESVMTA